MAIAMEKHTELRPANPLYRWGVLVFISLAMFGNYYVYDCISPIADLLKSGLSFSDSDIGFLQAIYSIPNVIMVLISGLIIDYLGPRKSALIFSFICMVGAIITSLRGDLWVMAGGRLIFGMGAESLIVAITTVIAKWFKGKELSFAFGLNLTIARLGSFAALNSPSWAKEMYHSWQGPLLLAVIAALISVGAVVIYSYLDIYAQKRYELGQAAPTDKIEFKAIFKFDSSFWFITLLCVTFYSAVFPFQTFAVKFFQEFHMLSRETSGFLSSILTLSAMVLTPLFGLFSDYIGRRAQLMMLGSILIIPVYTILLNTAISPYIPMIMLGVAFSLVPAIMWPSVALIVPEQKLGTAYGLMTMIQNIGLAGFNLLIGAVNDQTGGYSIGMYIFSSLGFIGLIWAFLLKKSQQRLHGNRLEIGMGKNI